MFLCFACHETELFSYFSLNFNQIAKDHRHKPNAPQTVGDAHFEPAVMGGAGVVVVVSNIEMDFWQG